jgi:alcohol dehydrogenase
MRMKAAILFEQGLPRPYAKTRPLVVEEVELDPPGPGEILIEVAAAGLCHSDLSTIENQRPRPLPIVIGHEGAGIVRECGAGITDLKPGDHVITFSLHPAAPVVTARGVGRISVQVAMRPARRVPW